MVGSPSFNAFRLIDRGGPLKPFLLNVLLCALFLALSFLYFHLALDNGFWHTDDFGYLAHNLHMTETKTALFDIAPPYKFQPLVYGVSYFLFNRFGFEPRGYFLFNLLLHGLNAFLVYSPCADAAPRPHGRGGLGASLRLHGRQLRQDRS